MESEMEFELVDEGTVFLRSLYEDDLKDNLEYDGIEDLKNIKHKYFKKGSKSMKYIAKCVKIYLTNLTKSLISAEKTEKEIELIIQQRMDEFKEIVLDKRSYFASQGFLKRMTQKISEVENII